MEISDANGLAPAPGVSQVKGALRIRRRIGKQINGRTVELADKAPDAVLEWLKDSELKEIETMPAPNTDLDSKGEFHEKAEAAAGKEVEGCTRSRVRSVEFGINNS